ncbi:MAG: thioredoxin family protein [Verrucomicrobiales bacterium]|nr:thioredoxin family protein [Verrucomicrobiales bacterium]
MALTQSTMLKLGTRAPAFTLPDAITGRTVALGDFDGRPGLVVLFLCNHCPYVKHLSAGLSAFGREYAAKGLGIVAINSNDVANYPADCPDAMKVTAEAAGYTFPYLFDAGQSVAKAYRAACTPDIFLFDSQRELVYRGQFDDSRPGNGKPVTGADLRAACDAVLSGRIPAAEQKPSIGCNIKWKPGNEPDYAV